MLELKDVKSVLDRIVADTEGKDLSLKEKADVAAAVFQMAADRENIVLKLIKNRKMLNSIYNKNITEDKAK